MVISLNTLKIFIYAAENGNLTRTAEALYISQPAISKAIHALEEELGVSLFIRDKKTGLRLTDVGERILPFARQMLLMEEKIRQTAYLSRNMLEGTLRIASLPIGIEHVLVKAMGEFNRLYPQMKVEILEGSMEEVDRMVELHEAEFGISLFPADGFQSKPLIRDKIVVFSKHELPEKAISLAESDRHFLVCRSAMEAIAPVLGPAVFDKSHFTVTGASTVRLMVQEDLGIGIQSALLLGGEKSGFYLCPTVPEVRTDIVLIARDFQELSPAARRFVDIIPQSLEDHAAGS